jgi:hypothetical protein
MNLQIKKLAEQAGFQYIPEEGIGWAGNYNSSLTKFAELILSKVLDTVVNTDITSVVYTTHDKDRAGAVLTLVERGILKEFNITEKV